LGTGSTLSDISAVQDLRQELGQELNRLCAELGLPPSDGGGPLPSVQAHPEGLSPALEERLIALGGADHSGVSNQVLGAPEDFADQHTRHFQQLVSGQTAEAMVEHRVQLEQMYEGLRVEPAAYVGALHQYLAAALPALLAEDHDASPALTERVRQLLTVAFLDLGLLMRANTYRSRLDPLTGLPNRATFESRLQVDLARARRFRETVALMVIDVDHFKLVNDRHGHPAGDAMLQEVASTLKHQLREVDLVARTGGDEMIVLLPHLHPNEAEQVAEELRSAVAATQVPWKTGRLSVTLSIGTAIYPNDASDQDLLITRADKALYRAKSHGRNRVCMYCDLLERELATDHGRIVTLLAETSDWIRPILSALERRAPQLYEHSNSVARLCVDLARQMRVASAEVERIEQAALLHDIGATAVTGTLAERVLDEIPASLSVLEEHPVTGWEILKNVSGAEDLADMVRHHHESWDGSGYPDGLQGEEIPLGARIIRVADYMHTQATEWRSGRTRTSERLLKSVSAGAGHLFDPQVIKALDSLLRQHEGSGVHVWLEDMLGAACIRVG
jgi:diguanylate cyclase (GGDEF)-like protein/putative nucleotidyltransferase with HDIG domain